MTVVNAFCAQPPAHSLQETIVLSVQEPRPTCCLLFSMWSNWHQDDVTACARNHTDRFHRMNTWRVFSTCNFLPTSHWPGRRLRRLNNFPRFNSLTGCIPQRFANLIKLGSQTCLKKPEVSPLHNKVALNFLLDPNTRGLLWVYF